MIEGAVEPVVLHHVDELAVPDANTPPKITHDMRSIGHRLHPAGHDEVRLPQADRSVSVSYRCQPRQTHLVDGQRRNCHRDVCSSCSLAGSDLPLPGLQDLTEDHLVDALWRQASPPERPGHGMATKLDGVEGGGGAPVFPYCCAGRPADHGSHEPIVPTGTMPECCS